MAGLSKKTSKSESLTIRLDPKTRFMLEFVSRLKGQTITTVVERAIADAANREKVSIENPFSERHDTATWKDYWSVSDAERALKLATLADIHPTFEEDRRLDFTRRWWQFFYAHEHSQSVDRQLADILWPQIDHFIDIEETHRQRDALAAGRAMATALTAAGIIPPEWHPANMDLPF